MQNNKVISPELAEEMAKAVGFRNLVAHEYAKLDLEQVYAIATTGLQDIEAFIKQL